MCRRNQLCYDGRCVQCVSDQNCGPGTKCDLEEGVCFSVRNRCDIDTDCGQGRRCLLADHQCILPMCENDSQCRSEDVRQKCNLEQFKCYLPAPVCEADPDEPNNTIAVAIPITSESYAGKLCRGDDDFFLVAIEASKTYVAILEVVGRTNGIRFSLLDLSGIEISSTQFSGRSSKMSIRYQSESAGRFYVKVSGNSIEADQWTYSLKIETHALPPPPETPDESEDEEENDETSFEVID